jgi:hypothetical protein
MIRVFKILFKYGIYSVYIDVDRISFWNGSFTDQVELHKKHTESSVFSMFSWIKFHYFRSYTMIFNPFLIDDSTRSETGN